MGQDGVVRVLAVLVLVVALAGCGDDTDPAAFDDLPAGDAVVEPAGRTLVPVDPPEGFIPQIVDPETDRYSPGYASLYAEPGSMDPTTDPMLLAVWAQPESDGALPGAYGPPDRVSGQEGERQWITWGVPNDYTDPDSAGVLGRGVAEEELRRAADSLVLDPPIVEESVPRTASLTDLPDGFVEVAAGPVTLTEYFFNGVTRGGSLVRWTDGDATMVVATYRHDDTLALLLRAGIDDPGGTTIRGHVGAHGPQSIPAHGGSDGDVWTWTEDGVDVVVVTQGIEADEAAAMVESLTWSTDWDALTALASQPLDIPAAADKIVIRDGFAGGSWSWGIEAHPDDRVPGDFRFSDMVDIRHADGSPGLGAGGSLIADDASFTVVGDQHGTLFLGTVPAEVDRVELELEDGTVLEPELHAHEDGWGIEAWAVWVDEREAVAVGLRGFDAAGTDRLVDAGAELAAMGLPAPVGGSTGTRIVAN